MAILHSYYRPTQLDQALALLARTDERLVPLAGGTVLVPELETRARRDVDGVVDLAHLGLDAVHVHPDHIAIGAMVRLSDLMTHPVAGSLAGGILQRTGAYEGPVNLRNAATVGGTVAVAQPDSELYAALLALDAQVVVQDQEGRTVVPLSDFLGVSQGLIVEIRVPLHPALRSGHARVARTPKDRPIVAAVAVVGGETERVALCGVASRPVFAGAPLDPPDDCTGSPEYRRAMAQVLTERALAEARGDWERNLA